MPRVPPTFPPPGSNPISDALIARRGARGLTPLDATLLNAPNIAEGWNRFLGALRNRSSLRDDVRELMILRVAALNDAAFEWIHHEHVGREAGLTTEQLAYIGDVSSLSGTPNPLDALQSAALAFADASTRAITVPQLVFDNLRARLQESLSTDADGVTVEQQLVECTATVGGYNLVSRFLVALDVDDRANEHVVPPTFSPGVQTTNTYPVFIEQGVTLSTYVRFHPSGHNAPVIIFVNSLLTTHIMWDYVISHFAQDYTTITFDQRGHGESSIPLGPCTIPQLATDIVRILDYLHIKKAHAVVGVSQGGATALSFALQYPTRTERVVVCDTQAKSPAANKGAWDDRIALAKREGMAVLAEKTVERWFSDPKSPCSKGGPRYQTVLDFVASTSIEGFAKSAAALQGYDLVADGLLNASLGQHGPKVLLIAGEKDGSLPGGLRALGDEIGRGTKFEVIPGAGHLPMVDYPEKWLDVVAPWLKE